MAITVTKLSTDVLNKTWWAWLEQESARAPLTHNESYGLTRRVAYGGWHFGRKTRKAQRFEQWLFTHGAEVRQSQGVLHLEFVDESQATMFALKWS